VKQLRAAGPDTNGSSEPFFACSEAENHTAPMERDKKWAQGFSLSTFACL
jgi:hypothetical protein